MFILASDFLRALKSYGFTSHPKVGVLRVFVALKNPSSLPGLKRDTCIQWQAH
jgi:hypothetical protein